VAHLEFAIAWAYIQLRKQMHHQGHSIDGFLSPGDDIAFISELFPPPPPEYNSAIEDNAGYSLGYLGDLKRCWNTCIRLSYHLASHVVEHHLETDPHAQPLWSSSKTEKEVVYSKAVASLQAKLLYPMYYLHCVKFENMLTKFQSLCSVLLRVFCSLVPRVPPLGSWIRHRFIYQKTRIGSPKGTVYRYPDLSYYSSLYASSFLDAAALDGPRNSALLRRKLDQSPSYYINHGKNRQLLCISRKG
jgi:hypothetical protein